MNFLRFIASPSAWLLLALPILGLFGCGRGPDVEMTSPAPPRPQALHSRLQDQMDAFADLPYEHEPNKRTVILSERIQEPREWLLAVLKQGYVETGHTNSQWDAEAHSALAAYADYARVSSDDHNFAILTNAIIGALGKGCDDPMLRYMRLRYGLSDAGRTQEEFARAYMDVFRGMILSRYHPALKFMSGYRAVSAARDAESKGNRSEPIHHVTANLEDLARDTNAPASEVFDSVYLWVNFSTALGWPSYVMSDIQAILESSRADDPRCPQLQGLAEIDRAWKARGGGYAQTVTQPGWKDFEMHLAQAVKFLDKAWSRDSSNAYTAYLMMKTELGQGQGRARMEKWFQRAMSLNTNYYDAANLMSFYLQPRWYGSDEGALRFARSCVSSTKWGGHIPLVLADVHHSLAKYYQLKDSPAYWQKPGVWNDVRASYDKFFALNPGEYGFRHDYARDAYLCGQYQVFLAQAKLFPWTNFQYFGGQAEFQRMIEQASVTH